LFQPSRALYWLAKNPQVNYVLIEAADDIVVESDNGIILEQDKYTIQKNHTPLTDKSVDLWKTIAHWLDLCKSKTIDLNDCCFCIATNKILPDDYLIMKISGINGDKDLEKCIEEIELIASTASKTIKSYAEKLIKEKDLLRKILKRIIVCDGKDVSDLNDEIISFFRIPSKLPQENILNSLKGWIIDLAIEFWRNGEDAKISKESIDNQLLTLTLNSAREKTSETLKINFHFTKAEIIDHKERTFVKQISLIKTKHIDEIINDAINDFLCSQSERKRLLKLGEITSNMITSFDLRLIERWKSIFQRVTKDLDEASTEELKEKGYFIFDSTTDHKETINGEIPIEYYMTKGSYHRLSDSLEVGWHPNFKNILNK
jgi:hypothetical protein